MDLQTKLMTEYEWRKKAYQSGTKRPSWWGAQCLFPAARRRRILHDRCFQRFMLLVAALAAFLLPAFSTLSAHEEFAEGSIEVLETLQARRVSAISYGQPDNLEYQKHIFSRNDLLRGRMLLLDETHPLPADVPPPNTVSVAKYGKGMVPVRSLMVKTGEDMIDALSELFAQMKTKGADGIYVWQGALTKAQQKQALVESIRGLMKHYAPEKAVQTAKEMHDLPGNIELLQEYTVDLRQMNRETRMPEESALEETPQGQTLLQLAWRYGLIRSDKDKPYRFRYVGKAHAMAMTYLDLKLADYLEWMHQKKSMVIAAGGMPQYLILCQPMDGSHIAIDLPAGCVYEASLDNTGYALFACTL